MSKVTVIKTGGFVSIKFDNEGVLNLRREEAEGLVKLMQDKLMGDSIFTSENLDSSKNATVSGYRELYKTGKFVNREGMLNALAEDLLDQLTLKEEHESVGICSGKKIVKLRVPVKYLSETAKEEDQKVFQMYKTIADSIAEKGYGAIVFPAVRDDNGNPLFDLEVL